MNGAYDFSEKVALVTGGASGIGRETALAFADCGADVVIADVQVERGQDVVAGLEESGANATFVKTDVSEPADVESMVEVAVEEFGQLDFAHNNAGIRGERHQIDEYPQQAWQDVIDVNLTGVFTCVKHEVDRMLDHGGGAIVNTASVVGKAGLLEGCSYAAAKHGVLGITKTAAMEVSDRDVRVNAVCPGYIETPMLTQHGDRVVSDEASAEEIKALHPTDRLGRPEEVADAVVWLCSEDASFVTGTALDVDGGYLAGK